MSIFPMIQPEILETETEYPIYTEVKWDRKRNKPVFRGGNPVFVQGAEAVLTWAWKAFHTVRFRHEIYSWDYGNEAELLIGRQYTEDVKQAEAARQIKECLTINPYIQDVRDITVHFSDGKLAISGSMETVYGEVKIDV